MSGAAERLPCGRTRQRLLVMVADREAVPAGAHEATCPYCQATLEELELLWAPVREWRQQPVTVPQGLLQTVIARVRRMAQSPHHVVATGATGVTTVTSWVIALASSDAAQRTPGLSAVGRRGGEPEGGGRRAVVRRGADAVEVTEVGAAAVSLSLPVTAEAVPDLARLADDVRSNVIRQLEHMVNLEVSDVDVTVEDLGPDL